MKTQQFVFKCKVVLKQLMVPEAHGHFPLMKLSYLEELLYRTNLDTEGQMLVANMLSVHLDLPALLSHDLLVDALYLTLLKHHRLWCQFIGFELKPAALRLEDLKPLIDFKINTVDGLHILDKQKIMEEALNSRFDEDSLGWKFQVFLSLPQSTGALHSYDMHVLMTMKHELGDGCSAEQFSYEFVTNLEYQVVEKTPVRLTALIPDMEKPVDETQSIHPLRWNLFLWIFEFLFKICMGFWLCLQSCRGLFRLRRPYSGTKPPSMLHEKTTGFRTIELDPSLLVRLHHNNEKDSLTSILSTAALGAYATLLDQYHIPSSRFTFSTVTDVRPTGSQLGLGIYPISVHGYEMLDQDLFWSHATKIGDQVKNRKRYLGAFIRTMRWIPLILSTFLLGQRSVYDKRDSAFSILDQSQRKPTFMFSTVSSMLSSVNSFWTGNRYLFHLTIGTMEGRPIVGVAYPCYKVTEKEMDQFVASLKLILLRASLDRKTTIGMCRKSSMTPKEQLYVEDHIKGLILATNEQ
jgi:hypothetical protein